MTLARKWQTLSYSEEDATSLLKQRSTYEISCLSLPNLVPILAGSECPWCTDTIGYILHKPEEPSTVYLPGVRNVSDINPLQEAWTQEGGRVLHQKFPHRKGEEWRWHCTNIPWPRTNWDNEAATSSVYLFMECPANTKVAWTAE